MKWKLNSTFVIVHWFGIAKKATFKKIILINETSDRIAQLNKGNKCDPPPHAVYYGVYHFSLWNFTSIKNPVSNRQWIWDEFYSQIQFLIL